MGGRFHPLFPLAESGLVTKGGSQSTLLFKQHVTRGFGKSVSLLHNRVGTQTGET